jgi:hypothetical protein
MKGDFSRRTFNRSKHYSAVLQEQGRMLTDADLDEQGGIVAHRIEQEAADLIGGCGGPIGDAGFEITESSGELLIGAGRYYVDGILVENDELVENHEAEEIAFTDQPDLPEPEWPPSGGTGKYVAYLDVWRRLITALDDPLIREVALGGPTTSAREKFVWQVRLAETDNEATCLTDLPEMEETTGEMAAQADPEVAPVDPCDVPLTAGFKGLENQFYRIEIHRSGLAYDLTNDDEIFPIAEFVQGQNNQVVLAGATDPPKKGDAVVYGTGDGANVVELGFGHIVEDVSGDNIATLTANLHPVSLTEAPWLRKVEATFVWSRDNGSQVTAIEDINDNEIIVRDIGPDDMRGFGPNQWVELTDDRNDLHQRPGLLLRVDGIERENDLVRVKTSPGEFDFNPEYNPKLRRWDGAGGISFNKPGDDAGDWLHIEDGIQVHFTEGNYRTGDYWHFPARTATIDPSLGVIEWPREGDIPQALPPHGIEHHYCKLALFDLTVDDDETQTIENVTDCRKLFPPVTELTNLLCVGGNAREGVADPTGGNLQQIAVEPDLQVRVANGSFPVEGARVQFTITAGTGTLPDGNVVATDAEGIATCRWDLGGSPDVQVCEVRLLDAADQPLAHQAVNFHARLSKAELVSYDPQECRFLSDQNVKTVQEAIDALCRREPSGGGCCCIVVGPGAEFEMLNDALRELIERGETDICICLLPGDHHLEFLKEGIDDPEREVHLKVKGCGPNTRIRLHGDIHLVRFASVIFRDVEIEAERGIGIDFHNCDRVEIGSCQIRGTREDRALVEIHSASNLLVSNCMIEASRTRDFRTPIRVFEDFAALGELFRIENPHDFRAVAHKLGAEIANMEQGQREEIIGQVEKRVGGLSRALTRSEQRDYQKFIDEIARPRPNPKAVASILENLRLVTIKSVPGIALEIAGVLDDQDREEPRPLGHDAMSILENNVIAGIVSLYGPAEPDSDEEFPSPNVVELLFRAREINQPVIFGGMGAFHLRGNRLVRLLVSRPAAERLNRLEISFESDLGEYFDNMFVSENVFEGMPSQVITEHLSMSGNDFNQSVEGEHLVGSVVADAAIYSGNHGFLEGREIPAIITDFSRVRSEAANLELEIQ